MRRFCTLVLIVACLLTVSVGLAGTKPETEDQKVLYALGLALADRISAFGLSAEELVYVKAGLDDGALKAEPHVTLQTYGPKIQEFVNQRMAKASETQKKAGDDWAVKMAKQPGAVTTESGMVYIETAAGTGESPGPTAKVKLHYHGTLSDGTVFDSSVERGTPASFPLDGVIECFSEGLQRMNVGGKSQLICPPGIAYGDRGSPPKIMPGATLSFEVELIEIESK